MKPEEYIRKNAAGFDAEVPSGHRERFSERLDAALNQESGRRKSHRPVIIASWSVASWSVAAILALFFGWFGPGIFRSVPADKAVAEVLDYYTDLLKEEAGPVYQLAGKLDEESRQELLRSIGELTCINLDKNSVQFGEEHQITLIYNIYQNYSESIGFLTGLLENHTDGCAAGQF